MEWKDAGIVFGTNEMTLPTSFRELWLSIAPTTNTMVRYTINIVVYNLPEDGLREYTTGSADNSSNLSLVRVLVVGRTSIRIKQVIHDQSDLTDLAALRVFYR